MIYEKQDQKGKRGDMQILLKKKEIVNLLLMLSICLNLDHILFLADQNDVDSNDQFKRIINKPAPNGQTSKRPSLIQKIRDRIKNRRTTTVGILPSTTVSELTTTTTTKETTAMTGSKIKLKQ